MSSKKAGTDAYKKAAKKVISQIDKLKLQTTQLAETAAKPATVGAVTRNVKTTTLDVSGQNTEGTDNTADVKNNDDATSADTSNSEAAPEKLSGQSLYIKTIRIIH